MSSLLPIRSEPSTGDDEPRVVDLDGEEADEVFSALSSSTAREIVAALHEEPRTQSEISEALDTTVQNVRYHLDKLEEAGLVEVVDTWYSSRGNEMSVYAPADGALIVAGNDRQRSRIRTALSRLVGGVTVIGTASLLVQGLFGGSLLPTPGLQGGGSRDRRPAGGSEDLQDGDGGDGGASPTEAVETRGDDGYSAAAGNNSSQVDQARVDNATLTGNESGDPTATVQQTATEPTTSLEPTTVGEVANAANPGTAGGLPPGLLFFLGGVTVLVVVVAVAYLSGR